jgi:predicted transglutaminase-like cysteine proteinase
MFSSPKSRGALARAGVAAGLLVGFVSAAAAVAAPMATGGVTSQPIGHFEFCKANPAECNIRVQDKGPERMTSALWQKIGDINLSVNKSVKPMNDVDLYGKDEVWAYPDGAGDCEDYVLEKRRELNAKGISLANLLITVVRKPDGEGHAVLTVRTDKGDFILDNLTDRVRPWDDTGYRYLKRQSSEYTGRWVSIREGQATMVGAVQ